MKKYISLLLVVMMLFALAVPALAEDDDAGEPAFEVPAEVEGAVVILHSNDVHGAIEGYAKMDTLRNMYVEAGAEVIVVDAGDFSQGTTYVSVSEGSSAISLMNMVGYDVVAPGNHEFDYGYENLKKLERMANFPILAANVLYEGEPAFGCHQIIEKGGVKIGFFGLDTPETASKAHPAKIKGVTFAGGEEMYAIAQKEVDELKEEGADYIVCLGHLGIDDESAANGNRSIDLLEKVTGIDIFIDGHSHSTEEQLAEKIGNEERMVGKTMVTSTGTKFANVGVVTIDPESKMFSSVCVSTDQITVAEDSVISEEAAKVVAEIEADYGATFATSEVELNGAKAPNGNRDSETNNGDLITDAMLWYATKEDLGVPAENVVALTNGGGIRAAIKVGDVTKNDVNTVLPFGNTVAVDYVTGAVLLEALEASTFCTPDAVGGFPQVAGIEFTLDTRKAFDKGELYGDTTYYAPASINRVTINSINGKEFDPEATYAVVTNDFVAVGGDTYYALSTSERITDTGTPLDEALMAYITEVLGGVIPADKYAAPQGRITIKTFPSDMTDKEAWWYEAAAYCINNGTIEGTDVGFEPAAEVTAATVYQVLYNREGKPELEGEATVTTPEDAWYTDCINWAAANELFEGTEFTDDVIDRAGIQAILEAYCAMNARTTKGLMVGNENGDMMLDKTLTRAEFATILMRLDSVR